MIMKLSFKNKFTPNSLRDLLNLLDLDIILYKGIMIVLKYLPHI